MERPFVRIAGGKIVLRWPDNEIELTPEQAMTLFGDEKTRGAIRFSVQWLHGQITFKNKDTETSLALAGGMGH